MAEQDMNAQKGADMGSMDTDKKGEMGREGSSTMGGSDSGANLKNDPGRASEAGRKS